MMSICETEKIFGDESNHNSREVLFCRLQVAGHKYKMSPVAMHNLKLIVVYYS